MISPSKNHCPVPVGTVFRQRTIWAPRQGKSSDPWMWTVSVIDFPDGPMIEAHGPNERFSLVATNPTEESGIIGMTSVLAEAVALLDQENGWRPLVVPTCDVAGCDRPIPMWAVASRHGPQECLVCQTRTVLACRECGRPDLANYTCREKMLREELCFSCNLWTERIGEMQVVSRAWETYSIGRGGGSASSKGFGGARWVVTFDDGRVVNTDDLWSGGPVPEHFRDRFQPNATVAGASHASTATEA